MAVKNANRCATIDSGLVYVLVLVVLWFVAWISMPFKLDRVNQNLAEIKELLREQKQNKRRAKSLQGSDL